MNKNSPFIATKTIKILPGMNMFLKFINTAQDYNVLKDGQTINLTPITDEELRSIKKIVMV